MGLNGMDYTVLALAALIALLFPVARMLPRKRRREDTALDPDNPCLRLEMLRDLRGRLLAEFIPMEPIGDIEQLRAFQGQWLRDSHPQGEPLGHALRHEDRYYWDIMVVRQQDGPRLAVHFSITGELYLVLSPSIGRATN